MREGPLPASSSVGQDEGRDIEALRAKVGQFEDVLRDALRDKYAAYPHEMGETVMTRGPLGRWNLLEFFNRYVSSDTYPVDRLERLIYQLFDIKLQLYYILEVDLGLYNALVHDRGYDPKNPSKTPHVLLTRFSLDQALMGKSRLLWERIMNFVYYLETGEGLEIKRSAKRSKRFAFFDFVASSPRWRWLEPHGPGLEAYEEAFRTPEYHKSSVLRAELLGGREVNPNELLELLNRAINSVWDNVLSIVTGGKATSFNELHMGQSGEIDAKYLE